MSDQDALYIENEGEIVVQDVANAALQAVVIRPIWLYYGRGLEEVLRHSEAARKRHFILDLEECGHGSNDDRDFLILPFFALLKRHREEADFSCCLIGVDAKFQAWLTRNGHDTRFPVYASLDEALAEVVHAYEVRRTQGGLPPE